MAKNHSAEPQKEVCEPQDSQKDSQPENEAPEELIAYRPADYDDRRFLTGYHYRPKRLPSPETNNKESLLCNIPRELILMIMERLRPADLYFLQQTSKLFYSCFCDPVFRRRHKPIQGVHPTVAFCSDPRTGKRSLRNLTLEEILGAEEKLRAWQRVEFDSRDWKMSYADNRQIQGILRQKRFCLDCKDHGRCDWSIEKQNVKWLYCSPCREPHKAFYFSQKEADQTRHSCLLHTGMKKICPHHSISLDDTKQHRNNKYGSKVQVFNCSECASGFCSGPLERPPTLHFHKPRSRSKANSFELDWNIKLCDLIKGQVVTKDFLRRHLENLPDDFLCPHAAWNREILLRPFDRDRCICFSTSATADDRSLRHSCLAGSCCLCHDSRGSNWGKFMNVGRRRHVAECSRCPSKYDWQRRGAEVFLSRREFWPEFKRWELAKWAKQFDVDTFRVGQRYGATCRSNGCPNSKPLIPVGDRPWWGAELEEYHRCRAEHERISLDAE